MPIDLVIDERDTKPDLGDNNNSSSNGSGGPGAGMGGTSNGGHGRGGSADPHSGHHSDSASTPDHQVCFFFSLIFFHFSHKQNITTHISRTFVFYFSFFVTNSCDHFSLSHILPLTLFLLFLYFWNTRMSQISGNKVCEG